MSDAIDPIQDRYSAIHEAGHAVAAVLLDQGLECVVIGAGRLPDGRTIGGYYNFSKVTYGSIVGQGDRAIPSIVMCLAGPIAEFRMNKVRLDPNKTEDFKQALHLAALAAGQDHALGQGRHQVETRAEDQRTLYELARISAEAFVEDRWDLILTLADQLQLRRTMTGAEVATFLEATNALAVRSSTGCAPRIAKSVEREVSPGSDESGKIV